MLLVTGGAGYIGSHVCLALAEAGRDFVVLDDLSTGNHRVFQRIFQLTGVKVPLIVADICDKASLVDLFQKYQIDAVLHFAAKKSIAESIIKPHIYYSVNVLGLMNLCEVMHNFSINKIVFSSSATVYGDCTHVPVSEQEPTNRATNPYGSTKLIGEQFLFELCAARKYFSTAILRYFNPIGAHSSGEIGEHVIGKPSNLVPYLLKVASGQLERLTVYGNDYPTSDGTGVRDYIHVVDLARGHLHALDALNVKSGMNVWNLGTGKGYSVLQLIHTFEQVTGLSVPIKLAARRDGDVASSYADVRKAKSELNWSAEADLYQMLSDAWRWHQKYPNGYL